MRQGRATVHVVAHITCTDGLKLETWKGGSLADIKRAVSAKYPTCKITYGRSWRTYSYGAH